MKNSKSLSKAIGKLIKDKELMIRMGIQGRKLAEKKFSIIDVIKTHLEIYNKLISKSLK